MPDICSGHDEESVALGLRNRAASYLWDCMSEIRAAGVFAFRNEPEVLPLFRSAYRAKHRGARGAAPAPEPVPVQPPKPNPTT